MIKFLVTLVLMLIVSEAVEARTCTTTCNTYGGQTSCTTQCW
jgi:hypothetical protein